MRARAVEFAGPRAVRIVDVEMDEPGPGELLVRTESSGISGGTEMLAYRGELDPSLPLDETLGALGGTFRYPFRYGYSAVGLVERSGGPLEVGDRVFAFHPHQDRFVVPEDEVVTLGGIEPRVATLFPLVETALQIALDVDPGLGERVVVLGLGAVGALAGVLLARAGATVLGADPLPWRREAATSFGLEAVEPGLLAGRVGKAGVATVVEASGNPEALAGALALLAHEGVVWVASWFGSKPVPLPLGAEFHRRRLSIRSTQVSTIPRRLAGEWDRQRRRMAARRLLEELPLAALATHEFAFEEAGRAYEAIDRGEEGLVHAALTYG